MRRTAITSLVLALGIAVPAFPEIVIKTKDGHTIRVQVEPSEIASITFIGGTTTPPQPPSFSPASLSGNWHGYNPHVPRDGSCRIYMENGKLVLISEINTRGEATMSDSTTIVSFWGGTRVVGKLVSNGNRINWDNGTYWVRK